MGRELTLYRMGDRGLAKLLGCEWFFFPMPCCSVSLKLISVWISHFLCNSTTFTSLYFLKRFHLPCPPHLPQ